MFLARPPRDKEPAAHNSASAVADMTSTNIRAKRPSPDSTASKIATESVCVCPGMLPATIIVAPKSPNDRAKLSEASELKPRHASGSVTRQNVLHSEAPRLCAAHSNR
jgi:hypothetical protein